MPFIRKDDECYADASNLDHRLQKKQKALVFLTTIAMKLNLFLISS